MYFGCIIGLVFLFSGVLSAPLDNSDVSTDKKISDPIPPVVMTYQTSLDSSLIKEKSTEDIEDKAYYIRNNMTSEEDKKDVSTLAKEDKGSKQAQLIDNSSLLGKKVDVKSEMKDNSKVSPSLKSTDKNDVVAVPKDKKDHTVLEVSPDIVDVQIDNEIDDNKVKENLVKAVDSVSTSQDGKLETHHKLPPQKSSGVSQVIGNFIYEMMQAPIYLLKAFKDLIGGMLGIRQPVATTTTTVSASAP